MTKVTVFIGKRIEQRTDHFPEGTIMFPEVNEQGRPVHADFVARWVRNEVATGKLGDDVKIVTHSETLANQLGLLVYEKKLHHDNVTIAMYGLDDDDSPLLETGVYKFDAEGMLRCTWPANSHWPYGWFMTSL